MLIDYFNAKTQKVAFAPFQVSMFHYDLLMHSIEIIEICRCEKCASKATMFMNLASAVKDSNCQYGTALAFKNILLEKSTCLIQINANPALQSWKVALMVRIATISVTEKNKL
jgi:hypothetical protein